MKLAAAQLVLVVLAGVVGFRLQPDSSTYANGELLPSPIGGAIGRLGGMPLLIAVSAIAAAGCVALLPSTRARALFMVLAGPWLLFPGVDALGVLVVALGARRRLGGRWWLPIAAVTHAVAGICAIPLLWRSRRAAAWAAAIAVTIAAAFTIDALVRQLEVGVVEHALYMSRYLLPAIWLFAGKRAEFGGPVLFAGATSSARTVTP